MTSRQFYFILALFVISLKVQKMPCIIYNFLEKDSYIVFLIFIVINILEICLAYYISQKMQNRRDDKGKQRMLYDFMLRICGVFIAGYFLMQGMLFYEAIQDLFSNILFDNLLWKLFSLFLLGSVFYLASFNFDNIGRICEVFFPIIIFSIIGIAFIGASKSDFLAILPLDTLRGSEIAKCLLKFNFWFGDFFIVLFLGSRTKGLKFGKTILTYILSMVMVVLLVIEFNGVYYDLAAIQPSLISILSEQALLGIDIGRIDWFLILVTEIGTAICSALCLCMAKHSFAYTFKSVNPNVFLFVMVAIYYAVDIWYLVDLNAKELFFMEIISRYSLVVKLSVLVLLVLKTININIKSKKYKTKLTNGSFVFYEKLNKNHKFNKYTNNSYIANYNNKDIKPNLKSSKCISEKGID